MGGVIGGGVEAVGTTVGNNFIKEVGQGVYIQQLDQQKWWEV